MNEMFWVMRQTCKAGLKNRTKIYMLLTLDMYNS